MWLAEYKIHFKLYDKHSEGFIYLDITELR